MRNRISRLAHVVLFRTLTAIFFLFGFTNSHAAALANFPFTVDTNPSIVVYPLQSATFNAGFLSNQYIAPDGFGAVLQTYPAALATTAPTALTQQSYFTITATSVPGQSVDFSRLQFEVGKGGDSDPRGFFVRSSVDGFASNLYSQVLPSGAQQAPAQVTLNLSSVAGMNNLSNVVFRFYVYTPNPLSNSVDFRNLTLSGTVAARPVPVDQFTWLLVLVVGACGGVLLYRRGMSGMRC